MSVNPPRLLAAMAVHLPCLPVLLFVFLAVHVPVTHADPPLLSTYNVSMCSDCGDVLMAASYNKSNLTSGGYGGVLKRGFELEWSRITEDGCHLCEASNGQCAYSQNREFILLCS